MIAKHPGRLTERITSLLEELRIGSEVDRQVLFGMQEVDDSGFWELDDQWVCTRQTGEPRWPGPLRGLPVAIKDLSDMIGYPTTCGASFFAQRHGLPVEDAEEVSRWRRSGASLIGKTHLNEFAYGLSGENRAFGPCEIPGSPGELTGGSSSGSAAAVRSGTAVIGMGTDTGGSIRVPAALTGLVGFRRSAGEEGWRGSFPLAPTFDTFGWLQRHVGDVPVVLKSLGWPPAPARQEWRIGLPRGAWMENCDDAVKAAVEEMIERIESCGAQLVEFPAENLIESREIFSKLQAAEAYRIHAQFLAEFGDQYDPAIRARLETGRALSAEDEAALRQRREGWIIQWQRWFDDCDLMAMPACPTARLTAATNTDDWRSRTLALTAPASLAGLPALCVSRPCPPEGCTGLQFIAPHAHELRLAQWAAWMDQHDL